VAASREKTKHTGVYTRRLSDGDTTIEISYKKDGRMIWEKIGRLSEGITPKYASHIRGERTRSIRLGEETPPDKRRREAASIPLDQFWTETYLPCIKKTHKSNLAALSRYTHHIKPVFGSRPIASITQLEVETFKESMLESHLSKGSVGLVLVTLKGIMNKAKALGLIKTVPTNGATAGIKLDNKRVAFFTKEQIHQVLTKTAGTDLHDIIFIAVKTGMRAGEIASLTWGMIDFNGKVVMIRGKNQRTMPVYLPDSVVDKLKAKLEAIRSDPFQAEHRGKPNHLVFPGELSGMKRNSMLPFNNLINGMGFNDGIEDRRYKLTFHSLRHTYASWLVQDGIPLHTVMNLMRHSSITMTERYSHLAPDHIRAVVDRL
jgi:integrase